MGSGGRKPEADTRDYSLHSFILPDQKIAPSVLIHCLKSTCERKLLDKKAQANISFSATSEAEVSSCSRGAETMLLSCVCLLHCSQRYYLYELIPI